jgi:CheY-like chemotaxis protein
MTRFLVVDDDPAVVHAIAGLLETDGHEVSPFTTGAQAVDALGREPFDAVVTDLEMAHVDGAQVARAARLHAPHACVVVVSGSSDAGRLRDVGACFVHDKPVDYEVLAGAVDRCRASGGPTGGVCPRIGTCDGSD